MALSIQLVRADREPYRFGKRVCGIVKFHTKKTDTVQAISIFFTGCTTATLKTHQADGMNTSPTRQSSGCLFRQHITLLRGEASLEAGEHVWPFAFDIPKYAQYCDSVQGSHGFGYFEAQDPFLGSRDAEMHLLPPSFTYNGRNKCTVAYFLEARLMRPATLLLSGCSNLTSNIVLNIQHRRTYDIASMTHVLPIRFHSQIFSLSTDPNLNMTKKLKKVLHQSEDVASVSTNSEPIAKTVQIHLETPHTIATRSQEPVKISIRATQVLKRDQQEKINTHVANVELKSFSVDLIQHTTVRAGGYSADESSTFSLTRGSCSITLPCRQITSASETHEALAESLRADLASTEHTQDSTSLQDWKPGRRDSTISSISSSTEDEFVNTPIDIGTRVRENLDIYRAQSPYEIAAAFSTYNCFRAYTLRVQLTLTCNGRTKKLQSKAIPVSLIEEHCQSYTHNEYGQNLEQFLTGFEPMFEGCHLAMRPALSSAEVHEVLPPYSRTVNA